MVEPGDEPPDWFAALGSGERPRPHTRRRREDAPGRRSAVVVTTSHPSVITRVIRRTRRSLMNGVSIGSRWLLVAVLAVGVFAKEEARAQEPGSVVAADPRVQGRSYTFPETGVEVPY